MVEGCVFRRGEKRNININTKDGGVLILSKVATEEAEDGSYICASIPWLIDPSHTSMGGFNLMLVPRQREWRQCQRCLVNTPRWDTLA